MHMAALRDSVRRLLYPDDAVCIACGALRVDDTERHLCRACAESLAPLAPPFCPRCGKSGWATECPDCLTRKPDALDTRASAYAYGGAARQLVRALKYSAVAPAADALAAAMVQALPIGRVDALVPVPLHRRRQRVRGFNQAALLCAALSAHTGLPVLDALIRPRATQTQTRLTREGRAENVRGAFEAALPVSGLSLLLVDDVLTTGSTAISCAEALKAAGAAWVILLTAANAHENGDA